MLVHNVLFQKKSGELRRIQFVKLNNLPPKFLRGKLSGTSKSKALAEGMELVWDIENQGFRTINWNTIFEHSEKDLDNVELL